MATLTNNQKQEALRKRRGALGQKELRSIYVTAEEEKALKPRIREMLKRMRKNDEEKTVENHYAVYVVGPSNDEPMYRNHNRDTYRVGEVIATFGKDYDLAKQYADSFTGYYQNVNAAVCGVHESARAGDDYNTFWADQLPGPVRAGWLEYLESIEHP